MAMPERTQQIDWAVMSELARRIAYATSNSEWEDIAQEALVRLWSHGVAVRYPRNWLLRVIRRLAVDRTRHHHSQRRGGGRVGSLDALPLGQPDDDAKRPMTFHDAHGGGELADAVALRLTLWPALRRLTPLCRLVMALRAQGWHHGEIARALGIPVATSRTRQNYAAARLRKLLADSEVV